MLVSIIITNHNYGRFVGRAIQSALAQEVLAPKDWEVIVVDDGSTDNSRTVLNEFAQDVRVIHHDEQRGLPAAINTGIRASRGVYTMRLDADDWLDRHAAFILSYFLDHNKDIGFAWPAYQVYDEQERVIGRISEPLGAGVMFRKQLLVDIGLYDEALLIHEDKDILLRCMERYPGHHMRIPLYRYYKHGTNMTEDGERAEHFRDLLVDKHGLASVQEMESGSGP